MDIIQADMERADDVVRVGEQAGDIDLLVNNAGTTSIASFLDETLADFDRYACQVIWCITLSHSNITSFGLS